MELFRNGMLKGVMLAVQGEVNVLWNKMQWCIKRVANYVLGESKETESLFKEIQYGFRIVCLLKFWSVWEILACLHWQNCSIGSYLLGECLETEVEVF